MMGKELEKPEPLVRRYTFCMIARSRPFSPLHVRATPAGSTTRRRRNSMRGPVEQQRLHQLIRQPKPIADRQFEIEFLESGVEAYCFTFG